MVSRKNNNLLKLSSISLLVLISTPHWGHDNVLLIPFLFYSIKNYNLHITLFRLNFLFSIYFLHLYKGIQIYLTHALSFLKFDSNLIELANSAIGYINILILLTFLILNLNLYKKLINN